MQHDRSRARAAQGLAQTRKVTAGNVARFMGDNADNLVRRFRLHQRSHMEKHVSAIDDESVVAGCTDQMDLDVLLAESGDLENGSRIVAQKALDLRVANKASGGIGWRN